MLKYFIILISFFISIPNLHSQLMSKKEEIYLEASKLMDSSMYEDAIKYFDWVIFKDDKYFQAHLKKAVCLSIIGNENEAVISFDAALLNAKTIKEKAQVHYNRAISYSNLNKINESIKDYTETIKLNPKLGQAFNNRGLEKERLGDLEGAKSDINQAIIRDTNNASFLYNLGRIHLVQKNYELAALIFTKSLIRDRNYLLSYLKRGDCFAHQKKFKMAFSDFDHFIKFTPNNAEAYLKRGYCNMALKNNDAACEDYRLSAKYGDKTAIDLINQFCK